ADRFQRKRKVFFFVFCDIADGDFHGSVPSRAFPEEPKQTVEDGKTGQKSQMTEADFREAESADYDAGGNKRYGEQHEENGLFVHKLLLILAVSSIL
ncbi:MAG: hypothetical protein IKX77_03190, partial [Clostridia bacterium]|nr:hypothetical protein [Clostridia bacterium]